MGHAEIQELFGVSRQRVSQLTAHPDFPEPVAVLAMGKVYDGRAVRAYKRKRDRRLAAGPRSTLR